MPPPRNTAQRPLRNRFENEICAACKTKGHTATWWNCPAKQSAPTPPAIVNLVHTVCSSFEPYYAQVARPNEPDSGIQLPSLIDTGSDVSLIARNAVPQGTKIDENRRIRIQWIDRKQLELPTAILDISANNGTQQCCIGVVGSIRPRCLLLLGKDYHGVEAAPLDGTDRPPPMPIVAPTVKEPSPERSALLPPDRQERNPGPELATAIESCELKAEPIAPGRNATGKKSQPARRHRRKWR